MMLRKSNYSLCLSQSNCLHVIIIDAKQKQSSRSREVLL